MLRSGAARSLRRSVFSSAHPPTRATSSNATFNTFITSNDRASGLRRPVNLSLAVHKPVTTALQRYASTKPVGPGTPFDKIDKQGEMQMAKEEIDPDPDAVSIDSSVRHVFSEEGVEDKEKDTDMLAGVKSDLKTIKETFALKDVPREALYIGMAGVLPYLATSLSTVYLAWDINHAAANGSHFMIPPHNAEIMLHIIEPIQIGYGAVIISFLGAIHWGMEWAKFGGEKGYRRYAIGVVAPALSWPTMLFPVEYALITQFLTFNFLYFVDARATVSGWVPQWYTTYRFVLTFVVGASIVISLIGRGQIADKISRMPGPADRLKALRDSQMESLESEERARRAKIVAKDQGEDDEDDEDDEE